MAKVADCSVVIATRNRRDDLRATLGELRRLDPAPAEIVVCMDACDDGSERMVAGEFPAVRLLVNDSPLGSVGSRDRLLREARSQFALSLDDDSHPCDDDFLDYALAQFADWRRLAVAYFPQRSEEFPESLDRADFGRSEFIASYASSGAVLRRATYLGLPGFPRLFFHAYEEPDYALQCLAAGWQVRKCGGRAIRHHYSATGRDEIRTHHRHARNELLSVLLRCPLPQAPAVAGFRLLRQFGYAGSRGPRWLAREPAWWLDFLRLAAAALRQRRAVSWRAYRGWLRLLRAPVADEREWLRLAGVSPHNPRQP